MTTTRTRHKRVPHEVTLRSYDVGFGDCFLLTFHYARSDRHVLIDFGSTRLPKGKTGGGNYMERIAHQIADDCGGKLHAVVATHRHKDHISGFTRNDGKGPGAVIRALKPDLVIQPWTEDPAAARDAKVPTKSLPRQRALRALHARSLQDMNAFADHVRATAPDRFKGAHLQAVREQLAFLGEDNGVPNFDAVKNLRTIAKRQRYVYYGVKSGLESILPGVTTRVLGPPTLEQTQSISKQRARDKDQFWQLTNARADFWARQATSAQADGERTLFPRHVEKRVPRDARWYRYQAQREHAGMLLSIVRSLDDQMNNTSVILLFEVGDKMLLFPGDAQYENWMYALSQSGVRERLARVNLYKVGHHGSLNATPKDLWNGFSNRSKSSRKDRLLSFLSTKDHVHGSETAHTEVPRQTLVDALKKESSLHDTRDIDKSALSLTYSLRIANGEEP